MGYEHLEIEVIDRVGWLWLNRPHKKNAMSADMWADIPLAVEDLSSDPDVAVIVVAGRGDSFTVGIDLAMLVAINQHDGPSEAARKLAMYWKIKELQRTNTAFAECPKPVVAAVHGYCLGAGIDLITACDIRLATKESVLGIRETKMGLVADVGTMQRLPRLIAPGHLAELVYTGKDFDGAEAERIGLVNRSYGTTDELFAAAREMAAEIASNSSLVVQGAKAVLKAEEDMSIDQALDHMALWNSSFLMSNDLMEAMSAHMEKRPPNYTGT